MLPLPLLPSGHLAFPWHPVHRGGGTLVPDRLPCALVFTLWWGPRVLLAVYLNAMLSIPLWGLEWQWAPLYAVPETLGVALAWALLRLRPFDPALPDLSHLLRFILLGVLLPIMPWCLGYRAISGVSGMRHVRSLLAGSATLWLADSLTALADRHPLAGLLTPWMRVARLVGALGV